MEKINKYSELEIKWATNILTEEFEKFIKDTYSHYFMDFYTVDGIDKYYTSATGKVVRHRIQNPTAAPASWPYTIMDGCHEINVKLRKSDTSIIDRYEYDLFFGKKTTSEDVGKVLKILDFKESVNIYKFSSIFQICQGDWNQENGDIDGVWITVALYECYNVAAPQEKSKFLEVEIEKNNTNLDLDKAKNILFEWKNKIEDHFKDKVKMLDLSLFEYYTGQKYPLGNECPV